MKRLFMLIPLLVSAAVSLSQCGAEAVSNNSMEQIHREEGVPVKVETVEPGLFEISYSYYALLSGVEESSVYSPLADDVEEVSVRVGDYVTEDQVLLRFPQNTPSARYRQAKVAYDNAKVTFQRVEQLYRSGSVAEQERDNAKAAFDVAAADWFAVRDMVELRAPLEGYVTRINVRESDNVESGDLLMTISQINRMKAKVWASDREILSIRKGQKATAIWNDTRISGEVVQVDMAMDNDRQAFGVVLEFDNPDKILKVGVLAEISIVTYSNPQALTVERKNIMRDGDRFFVYLAKDDQAEQRYVRPGKQEGLDIEIEEGLSRGELLITEGQLLLEPGNRIRIVQ
jgi:membrane fusion protein (multidrug efflux system)